MEAWKKPILKARNLGALTIDCPDCKAPVGKPCKTAWGNPARRPCMLRLRAPAAVKAVQDGLAALRAGDVTNG